MLVRERLAKEYKVAPSTIVRDAKFAEAVDLIAAENGPEARGARDWIIMNQLGRRNLTEEQRSYLRGKRHSEEKKAPSRPKKGCHSDTLNAAQKTKERLALEFKVAPSTIVRDAKFAEAVDLIAAENGPEARVALLNPDVGFSKKDAIRLVTEPPEVRAEILASKKKRAEWKKAPAQTPDEKAIEKQVAAFMAVWNRLTPEAREIAIAKIGHGPHLRIVS